MKVNSKTIKPSQREKLESLVNKTSEEVFQLCRLLNNKENTNKIITSFYKDSLIRMNDILSSISKLSHFDLDPIYILMRSYIEVNVDVLWIYSVFRKNKLNGENLVKRFYQMRANHFVNVSQSYPKVYKVDPYLKEISDLLNPEEEIEKASNTNLIELYEKEAKRELKKLQKRDWRALPGLIKNADEINFHNRSFVASTLAMELFNLKDAPYYKNWQTLNAFTHWSGAKINGFDEEVKKGLYLRNLNIALGFLHDVLNVIYIFMDIPVPEDIRMMRQEFIYMSL